MTYRITHFGVIAALTIAGFVLVFSPLFATKVSAQVGITKAFEINPVVVGGIAATAANTTIYNTGAAPRDLATTLLIIAGKTVLDSLTQSIVNWINSGFEGSPAFVTDLERNLQNLADAVAEDFIRGLDEVVQNNTGLSIRAPFQDQIARALREEFYRTTSSYGFDIRNPYTDCYAGRGFSLNGWFCESQNPANNVYGRYNLARNELFRQLDQAAQNRIRETGWGRGFLPWRGTCGPNGNTRTSAQGADLSTKEKNYRCPVRTPGAVIEEQLVGVLGSGVRQLELADNFNEIISALATQLLNQVLGGGGLSGVSQPSSGGGQSFIDSTAGANSAGSQLFGRTITQAQQQVTGYRDEWRRISDAAVAAERACTFDSAGRARADAVFDQATANTTTANQALGSLTDIEAERARISSSSSGSTQQEIQDLTNRFNAVLNSVEKISQAASSGLYQEMTDLAESCN